MIKLLTLEDYEDVLSLWEKAGLKIKKNGRDKFSNVKKQILSGKISLLGCKKENKLVGVVLLSDDGRKGWINRLAVHPDYQRMGIATKLIKESEKFFKSLGLEVYCALIEADNFKSKNCFLKEQWTMYKEVLYFSKRLSDES
ncbi:MAG: GNAT family N-acetyltransferase [Candidatus Hodarchaeales archaeon]